MPPSRLTTSRRQAITAAVVTSLASSVTLTACELDPPSATPPAEPTPPPAPDSDVVTAARSSILLMVATLERLVAEHPPLRSEVTPWLDLHAAHLAVLEEDAEDESDDTGAPDLPARRPAARRRVEGDEALLATALADAAGRASSGDLARALASMSAAVRQRVVT